MILLGYRTPTIKGLSIEEKMQLAKELDLNAVELGFNELKTEEDAMLWKSLKEKYGININSIGLGLNLCDEKQHENNLERLKNCIRLAGIVGIGIIFTRTDEAPSGIPQSETWKTCIRLTREYTHICVENGFKFAIEVDPPCFVDNLERLEFLVNEVNHPQLYVNYDPTNFYVRGSNFIQVIEKLKHRFVGGHIKDGVFRSDFKGEVKIGTGEVDYIQIFTKLLDESIDLTMHIEHAKTAQDVIDGISYIKGVLKCLKQGGESL